MKSVLPSLCSEVEESGSLSCSVSVSSFGISVLSEFMVPIIATANEESEAASPFRMNSENEPPLADTIAEMLASSRTGTRTVTARSNLYDVDPIESVTPMQITTVWFHFADPIGNMTFSTSSQSGSERNEKKYFSGCYYNNYKKSR